MSTFVFHSVSWTDAVTWLAWVLTHTIWQGAMIAGVLWLTLLIVKKSHSHARYLAACTALLALTVAPVVTGWLIWSPVRMASVDLVTTVRLPGEDSALDFETSDEPADVSSRHESRTGFTEGATKASQTSSFKFDRRMIRSTIDRVAPYLVGGWLVGVIIFAGRLLSSFQAVRRLRTSATRIADGPVLESFQRLCQRMNLLGRVSLMESVNVPVPAVIGWLRPIILLPLACASGLSVQQLEAVLAHELAHVRRHDYLINILQSFVETVLFYHPAVWWISRMMRTEREYCCDAIAIKLLNNPGLYAGALAELASLTVPSPRLVMSSNGGSLKERIRRIVHQQNSTSPSSGPVAILVALFLFSLILAATQNSKVIADDPKADAEASKPDQPTAPARKWNAHGGGSVGAEMFTLLEHTAVQKELGLSDEAIQKVEQIRQEFRKELMDMLPNRGIRVRNFARGNVRITTQEPTTAGLPVFKEAVAHARTQLKEVLTADQYQRLQQITWQEMGTSAFTDDELAAELSISNEQQKQIRDLIDDAFEKQSQPDNPSSPGVRVRAQSALRRERDEKLLDALTDDFREKFTALKGKQFAERLYRQIDTGTVDGVTPPPTPAPYSLVDNPIIQQELEANTDQVAKLKSLVEELRKTLDSIKSEREASLKGLYGDELETARKATREKSDRAKAAILEKSQAGLTATLTPEQMKRLKQIRWQSLGVDALFDSEVVEALSLSEEVQKNLQAIRDEYEKKLSQLMQAGRVADKEAETLQTEQDSKIEKLLSKAQLDRYDSLIGKEFDLAKSQREHVTQQMAKVREQRGQRGNVQPGNRALGREGGRPIVSSRRQYLSLIENKTVQNQLQVDQATAEKLEQFALSVREATRAKVDTVPNFNQMRVEEPKKFVDTILAIDDAVTESMIPELKKILTEDQYSRYRQIYWQVSGLKDPELQNLLSMSEAQRDEWKKIEAERLGKFDGEVSLTANAIFVRGSSNASTRQEQLARMKEFREKELNVLTPEQREKLTALRGPVIEPPNLRPQPNE